MAKAIDQESHWHRIMAKLQLARTELTRSGCILKMSRSRSTRHWVCRFRVRENGRVRHRNIYLGDAAIAVRAAALIRSWREAAITPDMHRQRAELAMFDTIARWRGYSDRARQRLREAAKASFRDPVSELHFAYQRSDDPEIRFGKPPGRPAHSGLW